VTAAGAKALRERVAEFDSEVEAGEPETVRAELSHGNQ
jgi:hypothetical protein